MRISSLATSVFIAISVLGAGAFADHQPIFIPVGNKGVYQFLPPFGINKSLEQMQTEANSARHRFTTVLDAPAPVARQKDLLDIVSPIKDQGKRGTCTAFATTGMMEALVRGKSQQKVSLSENFVYWAAKVLMKFDPYSEGLQHISQMLMTAVTVGTTTEQSWPYESLSWFEQPQAHPDCYKAYKTNPAHMPVQCVTNGNPSTAVQNAPKVKLAGQQASETSPEAIVGYINMGLPVEIGIDIYESSWQMKNVASPQFRAGKISMPAAADTPSGGHAVLIVGYDLDAQVYLFKNSWGTDEWGIQSTWKHNGVVTRVPGFGTIPMNYVRKYGEAGAGKI